MNGPDVPVTFWHRRVRAPLIALFSQGVTPDKIALSFAVGTACSLFPFLGFTSLLNLGAGLWLRLNQPLLQTLNQVLGPLQLLLILPAVHVGEWLWRAQGERFTLGEMIQVFRDASMGEFLRRFGWAGIHAFTAWALLSPLLAVVVYHSLRPILRRLASRSAARA